MLQDIDASFGLHYLDNAATTFPKPASVLQLAAKLCAMLRTTRATLCRLFGGSDPDHLVFGHNATDALNLVIFGIMRRGGHVISTRLEHNSVLRPIAHCEDEFDARATLVPFDGAGYVNPDDVRRALRPDTKLVVVNHGSNVIGTVQPVTEIGAICREAGVPFCIDAAQTAGMIPIDMQSMNLDIVAFTGHKSLLGPMGVGGLCVRPGVEIPHSRAGGSGVKSAQRRHLDEYPYRLEYGTPNMVGIAGLANGVAYIEELGGTAKVYQHEMALARELWEGLRALRRVKLYCATTLERRTPVLSFNIDGMDPSAVGTQLDVDHHVACRTGLHCAPLVHESIGTAPRGAVRFSIGPMTNEDDVRAAVAAVTAIAEG